MITQIQIPSDFASLSLTEKQDFYLAKSKALNDYYMANHLKMTQKQCNQLEEMMHRWVRLYVELAKQEG